MTVVLMWNCSGYKINITFLPAQLNSAPCVYPNERFSYDLDGSDLLPRKKCAWRA